jgi:hypothetical protein
VEQLVAEQFLLASLEQMVLVLELVLALRVIQR